jgi:hypothetical protein
MLRVERFAPVQENLVVNHMVVSVELNFNVLNCHRDGASLQQNACVFAPFRVAHRAKLQFELPVVRVDTNLLQEDRRLHEVVKPSSPNACQTSSTNNNEPERIVSWIRRRRFGCLPENMKGEIRLVRELLLHVGQSERRKRFQQPSAELAKGSERNLYLLQGLGIHGLPVSEPFPFLLGMSAPITPWQ